MMARIRAVEMCQLLLLYRTKRMAGLHPSPWTKLLLAALLSVSFPGDMGESGTPLQHPSWWGHTFKALPSHKGLSWGDSPR